ncbi:MAG: DUF1549 and DUF1553 domain-containing protein [Verrucomicrobia bacterium]|nr:DUF1549 and DUF1553 domain-containing protein [Verrucomicrobiota bacterium]MDA1069325.1 DUF1549 and DUF1553 domain-containing protein [Verrucomicrobiota bacterium]
MAAFTLFVLDGFATYEEPLKPHWAFQPLFSKKQIDEAASDSGLSIIDALIETRLERQGLEPNGEADKHTLIRRATYDLTGLPPTPGEISDFVNDRREDAYGKLIERLLASPAYGERWGRRWLDLARYADSNGADENHDYPEAWRYRDYVIRSFNQDKAYDLFIQEQLAGDLVPSSGNLKTDHDQITATGFLALGPKMLAEQDKDKMLIDIVDEQIDVVGQTFMGLTVSCARCHDHKFDPVSQKDYYALAGIFRSTKTMAHTDHVSRWVETVFDDPGNQAIVEKYELDLAALKAEIANLESELDAGKDIEDSAQTSEQAMQLADLRKKLQNLERAGAPVPKAMAVTEGEPLLMPVLARGDHLKPMGEPIPRGVGQLLADCLAPPSVEPSNSGRMELAAWLTDPRHPLTARVMVNRIWQGHFGFGLVRTPSNFGLRGEAPTHPELLDWLAREFMDSAWSIKHMHRTIMLSAAYRRSSQNNLEYSVTDPDNRLLWRQNRRRLEAESIRDAVLFVSGKLDQSGVSSPDNGDKGESYDGKKEEDTEPLIRTVYLPINRARHNEMSATFDAADPAVHHQQREATVVPGQALYMMNNELVMTAARDLAAEFSHLGSQSVPSSLNALYLRLFGRPALPRETEMLVGEGELQPADLKTRVSPTLEDWERICRVLLAANEFVYWN